MSLIYCGLSGLHPGGTTDGLNVLGLVVFSVALGIIISRLGETGKPLYAFFFGMAEAMMKLVILVIW